MYPYIHIVVDIPTYGLLVCIGLIVALVVCKKREKLYGYNDRVLLVITIFSFSGMILGSKILFFLTQMPEIIKETTFRKTIEIFVTSGFVFYGGLLGALLFTYVGAKILALDPQKTLSYVTPGFVIFHAFGRIGCFLGGCCYGIPWEYGIAMAETPEIRRFPVQLLEATIEFIIFIILLQIEKKRKYNLIIIYLIIYSIVRFFDEFLRGDNIRGIWYMGLSTSQYISIVILLFLLVYLLIHRNEDKIHLKEDQM